jgi:hypothetical protein
MKNSNTTTTKAKKVKRSVYDRQDAPPMATSAQVTEMWALTGYGARVVLEENFRGRDWWNR